MIRCWNCGTEVEGTAYSLRSPEANTEAVSLTGKQAKLLTKLLNAGPISALDGFSDSAILEAQQLIKTLSEVKG